MDIENVSKAGGFDSSEGAKAKVHKVDTANTNVSKSQSVTSDVRENANSAEDKGENDKTGKHQPSEATIIDAVSSANRKMERTRCEYSYHEETNRVSIKVFNADTDEVIREIPPEKSLDMLQKMWEMAGILIDEKL